MSFENLTPIRVGMTGSLAGKRYRVAGRVVMGMEEGGETYCWNEFNLVSDDGQSATLVYEVTERGGEWRLFTLFEPDYPMRAADAVTKRVGDSVNLEGTDMRVTLVDESRVYQIEGEAPEGVEVGDVARYFNAETGNKMLVVSWTGDEVEYFWGANLTGSTVMNAFGLRAETMAGSPASGFLKSLDAQTGPATSRSFLMVIGVFLFALVVYAAYSDFGPRFRRSRVVKIGAPAAPLAIGGAGKLEGKTWYNVGHIVVEIAQVGRVFDRHEYHLMDDERNRALLVYGLKPGEKEWFFFTALQPLSPLSPQQAAAVRAGQTVNVDGFVAPVTELFQSVIRQVEGDSDLPDLKNGALQFGFSAQSGSTLLLVRWNESGISFHRGQALSAGEVTSAFKKPPK